MKRNLLLIDDDRLVMSYYITALENDGFKVRQERDIDSALAYVQKGIDNIQAIILDIMMPSGDAYRQKDTKDGLESGVFLYQDIRKSSPDVPIVVLTNVRNDSTLARFPKEPCLRIAEKLDHPPAKLSHLVQTFITECETDLTDGTETVA